LRIRPFMVIIETNMYRLKMMLQKRTVQKMLQQKKYMRLRIQTIL